MASGGRRRRSREEDKAGSFGLGLLAAGAAAAGVAALAYGAKKLYDYVSEEARAEAAKLGSTSHPPPPPPPSTSQSQRSPPVQPIRRPNQQDRSGEVVNLAQRLDDFYMRHVQMSPELSRMAAAWVQHVRELVEECFALHCPDILVPNITPFGSATEKLLVAQDLQFDFLVTMGLDRHQWTLEDSGQASYRIKRTDSEGAPMEDVYNQMVADQSLNPEALTNYLMCALQGLTQNQSLNLQIDGAAIVVSSTEAPCNVRIVLHPAVCFQGVLVLASKGSLLWLECFHSREAQVLQLLDPNRCCHLRCLQIIKALRIAHPAQFGFLPSYIYKTILLHMIEDTPDPDFWRPESLQEQFIDYLNQLMFHLQSRKLLLFHNSDVNLLEMVSEAQCDNLVAFITKRIGKENLHTLLTIDGGTC